MPVVVHIITGLNTGGAERALYNVIQSGLAERFQTIVISLTDEGRYGPMLKELGVPVYCLGMKRGLPSIKVLWSLRRIIRKYQPGVIQGWMYHGNVFASLASLLSSKKTAVVWNMRHSLYDLKKEKRATQLVIRLNRWASKSPAKIIYNSKQSQLQHKKFGLYSRSSICIPNGVDLTKFALGIHQVKAGFPWADKGLNIVGLVARYHPMKDHAGFIKAALVLCEQKRNVAFVLVGSNVDVANKAFTELIPECFQDRFYLLGERGDVERVLQSIDCLVLASAWGEAFPNVLIEAMSSGRPCITTDVGDAAYIVGETGLVVPPKDPDALTDAMLQMLAKPAETRHALGQAARLRVEAKFSLTSVVDKYTDLYDELFS